jgi:hypothetical protein
MRTTHARLAGIVASGGLLMAAVAAPTAALASQPAPGHTVTICHATNSDGNPYVEETVDVASSGHLRGGHDTQHDGPIWTPGLKEAHVAWGDIIPAYVVGDFSYAGQNLDGGQAILDVGCMVETSGEAVVGEPADESPTDGQPTDTAGDEPTDAAPTDELPIDAAPTDELPPDELPTDATPTDELPTDDGEIVYDPIFITPTPEATPVGDVLAATGRPDVTPPATDTIGAARATTSGSGYQGVLLVLAGLSTSVLLLGRVPAARRR